MCKGQMFLYYALLQGVAIGLVLLLAGYVLYFTYRGTVAEYLSSIDQKIGVLDERTRETSESVEHIKSLLDNAIIEPYGN